MFRMLIITCEVVKTFHHFGIKLERNPPRS